jgi:hypothetical protein
MRDEHGPADETAVRHALYHAAREGSDEDRMELIVNTVIEVSGSAARASSVRLVLGGDPRSPRLVACHRVADDLARRPDGQWELTRRTIVGDTPGEPASWA